MTVEEQKEYDEFKAGLDLGVLPKFKKRERKPYTIPTIKPIDPVLGLAVFSGIALVGASIGAAIGTYVFFGTVTLVGLIALIESNKHLKYVAIRSSRGIDLVIFASTIYATAALGITVSAALVFSGLGYTLFYSPYLRSL